MKSYLLNNISIFVEKFVPGGEALGTLSAPNSPENGKKVFLWNALPGEIITEYNITKQKSRYIEAIATAIDHPSPHRTEPLDDCFLSTSPWQIISYDYELKLKQELVVELFREHHIDIPTPDIVTDGHDYHYRNKMEYALYWDNETGKISLAFHARGSHRKIPITKSSIEHPAIFRAATEIISDLNRRGEPARKYQSLLLRCNQAGEVQGGLYENHQPHPIFPHLTDTILGHTYSYSPNGFFQINLPVYELALKKIKTHITTDEVLDLYAGVGTIGLSVARNKTLTLVECDKYAFGEMTKNIARIARFEAVRDNGSEIASEPRDNGREQSGSRIELSSNIRAIIAKSENITNYINNKQTIILDPPRSGCDKKLIDKLNEIKPTIVIYLSCNPATQARDVKMLLENYQITQVKTFNFFPHTPHIENLVILQKSC